MIRSATVTDAPAVYNLMRQLSSHDFSWTQFEACYLHNLQTSYILVNEENRQINGCGILCIQYLLHFSIKTAEIINLIVDENARSQGIGRALIETMEQIAHENGCEFIEVASGKHRQDAHRFYAREGFTSNHIKFRKAVLTG